jgi:hypothetical protein
MKQDVFPSLWALVRFYADRQVERIYVKILAPNDNSKNQVYFGPGFKALTLFPTGEVVPDPSAQNPIFKASLDFCWIGDNQDLVEAPAAQVILYPQYPEVRFSGFLKGADRSHLDSIRDLMASRLQHRILFLGVDNRRRILGGVFSPESPVAREFHTVAPNLHAVSEIFTELIVSRFLGASPDPRNALLSELCRIHRLGWIPSKRLDAQGAPIPCRAPQCGGYTLEAELGIRPNGRAEPDFMGWEVKQHGGNVLTLMTPEPTGGFYVDRGVEAFVRTFGYPDRMGRADRLNFGGTHFCDEAHPSTGLTMKLVGYDAESQRISDQNGGIGLFSNTGAIAAFWGFAGILGHWNRKHNRAVYVPSEHATAPDNVYRYGNRVLLCEGTDPLYLIRSFHRRKVYYDPGIKLEGASTPTPVTKRRSQFRVRLRDLDGLYDSVLTEDVSAYCA